MALKTAHVADVPNLDHVPQKASLALYSTRNSTKGGGVGGGFKIPKIAVIGHRGKGMNMLNSADRRMKAVKENSIISFNTAANYPVDFFEFDVQVVFEHAKDRPIIFSSFQPDAALLVKKLQSTYPELNFYYDVRRNSLEEALKLCLEGGLEGVVSEVKAIFRNPAAVSKIKESNLSLLTYGKLNNVPEAVYMQHLMGVEGVIVDLVKEITEAVSDMIKPSGEAEEEIKAKPQFSRRELSFFAQADP